LQHSIAEVDGVRQMRTSLCKDSEAALTFRPKLVPRILLKLS